MSYVVEVNEGVVDITRQGVEWWNLYRLRFRDTDRIRDTKSPAVVGGRREHLAHGQTCPVCGVTP